MSHTVNDMIRKIRKSSDISQEEMALKLDMNRSTYAYKEKNGSFSIDEYLKISNIFGVSIDEMSLMPENFVPLKDKQILRQPELESPFKDDCSAVVTKNEMIIIREFRKLTKDDKEKVKYYIEKLLNNPEA